MKKNRLKKKLLLLSVVALTLVLVSCVPQEKENPKDKDYGVFLGMEDVSEIQGYELVIIDAYYLNQEDIQGLHERNGEVYTYLNIGTLENFRDGYETFRSFTFDVYDDWPQEYWMDVSQADWNEYLQEKAGKYQAMGVDGFFLDNTDVYSEYPTQAIYGGLIDIIQDLHQWDLPVIINGGDEFVKKGIDSKELDIDGINQETVFSAIDFSDNSFHENSDEQEAYYKEYLSFGAEHNLEIFLLEYTEDEALTSEIEAYCEENQYRCYISSSLELIEN